MKRNILLFIVILCFTTALQASEEVKEYSITVYDQEFAQVREIRELELKKGDVEYKLNDIPVKIDPESVFFEVLAKDKDMQLQLIEQTYNYDLNNIDTLFSKYLFSTETLVLVLKEGKEIDGNLVYFDKENIVLGEVKDEEEIQPIVINRNEIKFIKFPENPKGLVVKPNLWWKLRTTRKGDYKIALSYITFGIKGEVVYSAIINGSDLSQIFLSSNLTLTNTSGFSYEKVKVSLAAGKVKNAGINSNEIRYFPLDIKTSLRDNVANKINLFDNKTVSVSKVYFYNSLTTSNKVKIALVLNNDAAKGLGISLPKGKIQLYKRDEKGNLILIKEDEMPNLDLNENVNIVVADAQDISASHKQVESKNIEKDITEEVYEIEFVNNQKEQVNILVAAKISGDWQLLESSEPYIKKDFSTVEFSTLVPPQDKKVIKYKVKVKK